MAKAVKPGFKTSEFWLSTAAFTLGAIMASGAFEEGGSVVKIIGLIMSALSALGYGVARSVTKVAAGS